YAFLLCNLYKVCLCLGVPNDKGLNVMGILVFFDYALDNVSLHDALPISFYTAFKIGKQLFFNRRYSQKAGNQGFVYFNQFFKFIDRKSTRLNSSYVKISYAVFCVIKK